MAHCRYPYGYVFILGVPMTFCACLQQHVSKSVEADVQRSAGKPGVHRPDYDCAAKVWWLHIPKTGTTFGKSAHACDDLRVGGAYHQPVPEDVTADMLSTVVTMFRQPEQRLASMLAHIQKFNRTLEGQWGLSSGSLGSIYDQLSNGLNPANDNFLGHEMTGCQTRMLIGRDCFGTDLDDKDVDVAVGRINKMLFVGLQEEWALSICLFNRITTGKAFTEPWQLENARPTLNQTTTLYDTATYPADPYDSKTYARAKARFQLDLKKYKISKDACAHMWSGEPIDWPDA